MKTFIKILFPALIIILSGMSKGMADRIDFHQKTLPEFMHNSFWLQHGAPAEGIAPSWTNKYKDGDHKKGEKYWGSSRWFVPLTDGWHLMQFFYQWLLIIGSVLMYRAFRSKLHPLLIILIIGIMVSVGFGITYR